jgi:hypothetical protein
MPFTLAHPAAVLPLARLRPLPLSALVIGSVAPDLPYFLLLSTAHRFGHTAAGIWYFSVPAGLACWALFHAVLKMPLLSLLPEEHRRQLSAVASRPWFASWRALCLAALAVIVGVYTHVVWDSFTHADGWSARHLPWLGDSAFEFGGGKVPVFKVLQHLSTLLGLSLLGVAYGRWFRAAPVGEAVGPPLRLPVTRGRLAAAVLVSSSAVAACFCLFAARDGTKPNAGVKELTARFVVIAGASVFAQILLYCVAWHGRAPTGARPRRPG